MADIKKNQLVKYLMGDSLSSMADLVLAQNRKNEPTTNISSVVKGKSQMLARGLTYENPSGVNTDYSRRGSGQFNPPPYDLAEIARALDVEPYIAQSVRKHREMVLKEGYNIIGEDPAMLDYIEKRLFEIAIVSGKPTYEWIRELVTNLIVYHTSLAVYRRDFNRSSGKRVKMYGKTLDPIAGIYPVDPTGVEVSVDKHGTKKKIRQSITRGGFGREGNFVEFKPEDVMFMTVDKKSGISFGTPYILPVLDDVRALRRLEEIAITLATKEAFPLYHYKVGTPEQPAQVLEGGGSEIDMVRGEVANMPSAGSVVTSERHEIKLISRDGGGLDIKPFLEYFEARVMGGLRLSPLDVGRGGTANRACYSADTETLTNKGWKYHWEIDHKKDKIATYNPETGNIEYHFAENKYVYPYEGPMYRFQSKNTDVLVTPDHDMWFRYDDETEWHKAHADGIDLNRKFRFKVSSGWEGEDLGQIKIGDINVDSRDWIRFLGFFTVYGKLSGARSEVKLIIRDLERVDTIKEFMHTFPFRCRIYDNEDYTKVAINDINLTKHLSKEFACKTYPKKLPDYLVNSGADDMELYIDTVTTNSDLYDLTKVFHCRARGIGAQLQDIALKLGYASSILPMDRSSRIVFTRDDENLLTIDNVSKEEYDDEVFCYEVPNHLFITRRNGKVAIQGNTASNINKNVLDAAKDYQEVFSNAVTFNLFLPLLLEGGFDVNKDNIVKFVFPSIDREELRAQQNHGSQLYLSNVIDEDEFRRDYLNKKPLEEGKRTKTTRELDAEVEERLTKVAGAIKNTATSQTNTNRKTANNKGQPANQSGSKTKSRNKANDSLKIHLKSFKDQLLDMLDKEDELQDFWETFDSLIVRAVKKIAAGLGSQEKDVYLSIRPYFSQIRRILSSGASVAQITSLVDFMITAAPNRIVAEVFEHSSRKNNDATHKHKFKEGGVNE